MTVLLFSFAFIGALVTGLIGTVITHEIYRAIRQAYRVAYVAARINGRRGVTVKMWWKSFIYEMTNGYSSLRIAGFEIPRDPRQKIRRNRHW